MNIIETIYFIEMKLFTLYLVFTALFMACCHVNKKGTKGDGPIIGIDLGTTYSW